MSIVKRYVKMFSSSIKKKTMMELGTLMSAISKHEDINPYMKELMLQEINNELVSRTI